MTQTKKMRRKRGGATRSQAMSRVSSQQEVSAHVSNLRRSKCGMQASVEPETAHSLLKLTRPAPRSHTGARDGEEQRPQQHHLLRGLLPRRKDDRFRQLGQDPQSLGFRCSLFQKPPFPSIADASACLWQPRWISRLRRAPRTRTASILCSSHRMGSRLCLEAPPARSKSGIQASVESETGLPQEPWF